MKYRDIVISTDFIEIEYYLEQIGFEDAKYSSAEDNFLTGQEIKELGVDYSFLHCDDVYVLCEDMPTAGALQDKRKYGFAPMSVLRVYSDDENKTEKVLKILSDILEKDQLIIASA